MSKRKAVATLSIVLAVVYYVVVYQIVHYDETLAAKFRQQISVSVVDCWACERSAEY